MVDMVVLMCHGRNPRGVVDDDVSWLTWQALTWYVVCGRVAWLMWWCIVDVVCGVWSTWPESTWREVLVNGAWS